MSSTIIVREQSAPFTYVTSLICFFCNTSSDTLRSLLRLSLPQLFLYFETLLFTYTSSAITSLQNPDGMASFARPAPVPEGPSFFQSWALRLSQGVDAGVSSPSVSPSCVDHITSSPVLERSDLRKIYLPHPEEQSKHMTTSFHKRLITSPNGYSEDAGRPRNPPNPTDSFDRRRTRSRTSSNSCKAVKFFKFSIGSKGAKEDLPPPEGPSVAEVRQTVERKPWGQEASLFIAFQGATNENNISNPTSELSRPPPRRSTGVETERTSKKQDRRRLPIFPSFRGATIDKTDPIIQVQDSQRPSVIISKASPSAEEQVFEPGSSYTNKRRRSRGDSPRSSGIEVLYGRSKRFLKNKGRRSPSEPASDPVETQPATKVSELLDRVDSALVQHTYNNILKSPTPESRTSPQVAHARPTPPSARPAISNSSSILNLMFGKPPVNTPEAAALYGGRDNREFFKVEISNPNGPTFLPSEARRIGTPPLPSEGPRGRRRGWFFDLNNPTADSTPSDHDDSDDSDEPSTPRTEAELMTPRERLFSAVRRRSTGHNDWFSVQLMVEDARGVEERFKLNVPEHLLGSPLCPRSPMHKSGGKGICVYHGRS